MTPSASFRISPAVLLWARQSIGYSVEQAAKKAGVPEERFEQWEKGEKMPTFKQLQNLAETVYKRPVAMLFMQSPPDETPVERDFRNITSSEASTLSPQVKIALRRAKRYQSILEDINPVESAPKYKEFQTSLTENPSAAAARFREFLSFTLAEQKSWKGDKAFNNYKALVERIGIYIFHLKMPFEEARAFCITGKYPLIVLNTEDSVNGKIFSIFHEVCHILFNVNDIFKDSKTGTLKRTYEDIEAYCNQFAAAFLVPDSDFRDELLKQGIPENRVSDNIINGLARLYNVSNEVIARKLVSLQMLSERDFWTKKKLWDAGAKAAKQAQNLKMKENESKGFAQDIRILYEKGRPYVSQVISAYQQGIISSSDTANFLETKFNHINKIIDRLNS